MSMKDIKLKTRILKEKMSDHSLKMDELLSKLGTSRDKLEEYVTDLEDLKGKIESIFPTDMKNYRNKWALDEKVKTTSQFFDSLLRIRQEINRTLKDEVEIRRKLVNREGDEVAEEDVRALAEAINQTLKKEKKEKESNQKDNGSEKSEQKVKESDKDKESLQLN